MRRRAAPLAAALALGGCFGPRYERPSVETPSNFKELPGAVEWKRASPGDALPRGRWWEIFGDSRLNELEEKVADSNQSVVQAAAQYRQALELARATRATMFPSLTTQPSAQRSLGGDPPHGYKNSFTLPLTASWEPDFWGQIGKQVEGAKASAQASAANLEGLRLSLQAQLAIDYFSLSELDMEETLLNLSTASYAQALQLTRTRFKAGVAGQTDVSLAETQLESTRAQASDIALQRAVFEHAIAVLVGRAPSSFSLSTGAILGTPPPIPTSLPSALLERRPDVAAAERLVAAANANVGLARAAYFPVVTLTASGGYESGSFAHWFDWPSRIWSLGAAAAGTLIDFGRLRALSRQARDAYDAAVAGYRQTSLTAFQQVEDDLSSLAFLSQESVQQEAAVRAAETSLKLEMDRYKAGIVSYLDVIQTQNITLSNERAAAQVLGRRMEAAVALVRDLGGGWDDSLLPFAGKPRKR